MNEHAPRTAGGHGSPAPVLVVGVGASAGGLDACKRFFGEMPAQSGMAFIVIFHLDPAHESHLAELLKASTAMEVTQVTGEVRIEPDHVYVIAPNAALTIRGGVLSPSNPARPRGARKPIDTFFASLAEAYAERAVCIVLSGTGSNGSKGIEEIKAAGGMCIVQDPESAEYDGMPRSAIATGAADHVSLPEEMPGILVEHARHPEQARPEPAGHREGFEAVLELLEHRHGLDFRAYKKGTLRRRTERRMSLKQIHEWPDYLAYLRENPEELSALYDDLLIGVTRFFRDPEMWEYLEEHIIPSLLDEMDERAVVRIWVPGCATGEEAYSLAILILEQLRNRPVRPRLQIFASDVDEDALAFARKGVYPASIESDVSEERLRSFFHKQGDCFQIAQHVREQITFARQNILTDPPFSRQDIVSCRNLLIYLEPNIQTRVLELLHFALRPGGILVLGSAETIGRQADLFETASNKWRIYRATRAARARKHIPLPPWRAPKSEARAPEVSPGAAPKGDNVARIIQQIILDRYASACVVVDRRFEIVYFFGPTHDYLVQPTGEARLDLLSWLRPGLYPKLRPTLQSALATQERVIVEDIQMQREASIRRVTVTVEPLVSIPEAEEMLLVVFRDLPEVSTGSPEVAEHEQPLVRQLEEELKRSQRELQINIEQLENAVEEHRAREEELLSLNEELQSSNEELETSKEELQSLNEEVHTINRQLMEKNSELRQLYADLNNLLISTDVPTIFLDRDLRVRRFTPAATQLMCLVPSDVGRPLEHIKPRFPGESMIRDARTVLTKLAPIKAELRTEDGYTYLRRVLPYRTEDDRIDGVCITFNDITEQKQAAAEVEESRLYLQAIVGTIRTPLLVLDEEFRVVFANASFYDTFQVSKGETEGWYIYELGNRQWDIPRLRELLERVLPEQSTITDFRVEHDFERLGQRIMLLNAHVMTRPERPMLLLLAFEDITERVQAEEAAQSRARELEQEHHRKDEFLAMLGHELRNPLSVFEYGLELLEQPSGNSHHLDQVQAMMRRQAQRMSALLDQLLEVSRVVSGKITLTRELVDLRDPIRDGVEAMEPLLSEHKHQLSVSVPDAKVLVLGDALRLTQVVTNLLTNAAKYADDGGQISLALAADERAARITVRDTGIGIEPELLPHIFDLFTQGHQTLARSQGGLGLGLPLVRSLVEAHGGQVTASSPGAGQGSEFMVTLPRVRERRGPSPPEAQTGARGDDKRDAAVGAGPSPDGAGTRPHRILVVDDEVDSATMLAELLRMQGHDTRAVHGGQKALEAAASFRPEVVLLDLGLPDMDGYQVARRLREEQGGAELLLIAITGYQEDEPRLKRAGFDHHLIKPPDLAKLSTWLHERDHPAR